MSRQRTLTACTRTLAAVALCALSGLDSAQSRAADPESSSEPASRWSIGFSAGLIGDTSAPGDYYRFDFDTAIGAGEGWTYNFLFSRHLAELDWQIGWWHSRADLELPVMLSIVDDDGAGLFPDYNVGVLFRWRDWPWNESLRTTVAIGLGLSYTSKIWTMDRLRHPGEERAHLKFWMPLELTFARPKYPRHHLLLFIDHQLGGHITDEGGQDAWGFGYRYDFR